MTMLIAEIERAMSCPPTGDGWSCFVSNKALAALRDRGLELLPAIEEVVRQFRFADVQSVREGNLLILLLMYFETADEANIDVSGFVRSLEGLHLKKALLATLSDLGADARPGPQARDRATVVRGLAGTERLGIAVRRQTGLARTLCCRRKLEGGGRGCIGINHP